MRVHTETMSENFINENIHNMKKIVFEDFNEIKKLENNESVSQFKDNLSFENGRYSIKLPLEEFHDALPDNYQLAKNRFISLQNQLEKNESLLNEYEAILKEYLKNDIIEKVEEQNDGIRLGNVHYLPHRPVIKPNRETREVWVVFGASTHIEK